MIKKELKSVKEKNILKNFVEQYNAHKESEAQLKELKGSVIELFNTHFSDKERKAVLSEEKDKFLRLVAGDEISVKDILTLTNELDNEKILKVAMKEGYLYEIAKVVVGDLREHMTNTDIEKYVVDTKITDKIVVD